MVPPGTPDTPHISFRRCPAAVFVVFVLCLLVPSAGVAGAPRPGDAFLSPSSSTFSEEDQWWDGFSGTAVDGEVRAAVYWNGMLVVGGEFQSAGGAAGTRSLAAWDGSAWVSLGASGVERINALAVLGGDLVAAGRIFSAGGAPSDYIMRFDGFQWSSLGSGLNGEAFGLCVQGSDLVVGGLFTSAGGVGVNNIALWDGTLWSGLGAGLPGRVNAVTIYSGDIVAGGSFDSPGGGPDNLAVWTGSDWSKLGGSMQGGEVRALAVFQGSLVAGGSFTGGGSKNGPSFLAGYDGSWSSLGAGTNGWVGALVPFGNTLFVGGGFTQAGGAPASRIGIWDGSVWIPAGSGISGTSVLALATDGVEVTAGGNFYASDGDEALNVAVWNGAGWSGARSNPGNGLGGARACAMLAEPAALVVAGDFTSAGGVSALRVARWNGSVWEALGAGMNATVHSLCLFQGEIVAGGDFTLADGAPAARIARWDGSSWQPLGSGLNGAVHALAVYDGDLYAGGRFDMAGGVAVNNIARWDGSVWTDVGGGVEMLGEYADVTALLAYGGSLVVGGEFQMAGGFAIGTIARWNGTTWSPMGSGPWATGFVPRIEALTEFNGDLIAGGNFTRAGGVVGASFIGRWDGSWHGMGDPGSEVTALAGCGGQLAAGTETEVVFWNGADWASLGGGMGGRVHALADFYGDLYGGGGFSRAGTKSSLHIARWGGQQTGIGDPGQLPVMLQAFPNPFRSQTRIAFDLEAPGPVRFSVFDIRGRLLRAMDEGIRPAGPHTVIWDGRDAWGRRLPAGAYFYRVTAGGAVHTGKLQRVP